MNVFPEPPNDSQIPTTEQISAAAFHLYVENGCREGYDLDDWLRAEELLTQKLKTVARVPIFEPVRETMSRPVEVHQGRLREHSLSRDERCLTNREGIRQKFIQSRSASWQPQSHKERSLRAMYAA